MKKKITIALATVMLLLGSGTAVYAKKVPWGAIWDAISGFFGGDKIPCWSSGTASGDHRYTECASCMSVIGTPNGGGGECSPR